LCRLAWGFRLAWDFDALGDVRNKLRCNPNVQLIEKITDGTVGLGKLSGNHNTTSDAIVLAGAAGQDHAGTTCQVTTIVRALATV
jgi:hypothetical protein